MPVDGVTVHAVDAVALAVADAPLPWQVAARAEIDAHWAGLVARNPALWDGRTHLATGGVVTAGRFVATCHPARFAALLCWRDRGYPPLGFRTIFGSVVPLTADGAVLLGRMGTGTANAGRTYFPGGAFDGNDVADGAIDAAGGIARECAEEMGLSAPEITWDAGFLVCETPVRFAISRIARLPWDADEALSIVRDRVAAQETPELAGVLAVSSVEEAARAGAEPYVQGLVGWLESNGVIGA